MPRLLLPAAERVLVFVPNPASPGSLVTIRTTACADLAVVTVDATPIGAGAVLLGPGSRSEEAFGHVQVPDNITAGTYTLSGTCISGSTVQGTLRITRSFAGATAE